MRRRLVVTWNGIYVHPRHWWRWSEQSTGWFGRWHDTGHEGFVLAEDLDQATIAAQRALAEALGKDRDVIAMRRLGRFVELED